MPLLRLLQRFKILGQLILLKRFEEQSLGRELNHCESVGIEAVTITPIVLKDAAVRNW